MANSDRTASGLPGRMLGRVVGSVVNPIVGNVDVDEVVERIDVNQLLDRVDLDEMLDQIDPDRLLDRVDPNRLLDRVDPNRLLDRVDPNALLDRVDPDRLLDRVDPNRLLDRVDPNALLDRVEPDALVDRVDPNTLVGRIDPNPLLDRVDLNALVERVDADALLARIDVDLLLERVDPNLLLERVDMDALLERIDVNDIVERTELGAIIARSTTGVFSELLDVARAQIVTGDQITQGIAARLIRGAKRELPPVPGAADEHVEPGVMSPSERAVAVQGRSAGAVSRFLAFLVDQFAIGALFAMVALLLDTAVEVVIGSPIDTDRVPLVITYGLWAFVYTAGSLTASGRTIGKAVLGLLVVRADGSRLDGRHAALRTVAFPLSFLLFGVGFLLGLLRRDRRQLHDLIARTAVVYAWDARTALLRAESVGGDSRHIESAVTP